MDTTALPFSRRIGPALTLMFISPLIAEVLPGATRISSLFVYPPEVCIWGGGALLISLSRGVGSRGLLMPLDPKPTLVVTAANHPPVPDHLDAALVAIRRNEGSPLSRIKSLNYLDNVLAQQEAGARGAG